MVEARQAVLSLSSPASAAPCAVPQPSVRCRLHRTKWERARVCSVELRSCASRLIGFIFFSSFRSVLRAPQRHSSLLHISSSFFQHFLFISSHKNAGRGKHSSFFDVKENAVFTSDGEKVFLPDPPCVFTRDAGCQSNLICMEDWLSLKARAQIKSTQFCTEENQVKKIQERISSLLQRKHFHNHN